MEKRPIIGLSGYHNEEKKITQLGDRYADMILRAGALPVLLPRTTDESVICELLEKQGFAEVSCADRLLSDSGAGTTWFITARKGENP